MCQFRGSGSNFPRGDFVLLVCWDLPQAERCDRGLLTPFPANIVLVPVAEAESGRDHVWVEPADGGVALDRGMSGQRGGGNGPRCG
jgi:hypothetical protein